MIFDLTGTVAAFIAAALGAMGMGGGSILILYLTAINGSDHLWSQGINLLFFVPIAVVSLIVNSKNGFVRWETVLYCLIGGVVGVIAGSLIAEALGSYILRKIFGGFLLLIGVLEIYHSFKKNK